MYCMVNYRSNETGRGGALMACAPNPIFVVHIERNRKYLLHHIFKSNIFLREHMI